MKISGLTQKITIAFQLILLVFSLVAFALSCSNENSSDKDNLNEFFGILERAEVLSITLETDIQTLIDNKESEDKHYQPATLSIFDNGKPTVNMKIEVRPRGVTRRRLCDFPPVMLKAPKELREELDLKDTDNVKLVSYCKDDPLFKDIVLKEYLCYRLFNILTDFSYTVKLAKVSYKDSKSKHETVEKMGFMIEPTDVMAARLGCEVVGEEVPVKTIHRDHYKTFVVFQYMIGNTDWNRKLRHNIRFIKCDKDKGPLPIPYDFDYSGLVNAPYAEPHSMMPIKTVTERLFMWTNKDKDFSATYKLFLSKKDAFYAESRNFPHLDQRVKEEVIAYLDSFYEGNFASKRVENFLQI